MKFGTWLLNPHAGVGNPRRVGMFVESISRPRGGVNPGLHYKLTDGRGDFWSIVPEGLVQISEAAPALKPRGMVRVNGSGVVDRVTVETVNAEWITLVEEPGERYSAKTRLRERSWSMLIPPECYARHGLADALLKIEATTVGEYRNRAHALVMNWKGEV